MVLCVLYSLFFCFFSGSSRFFKICVLFCFTSYSLTCADLLLFLLCFFFVSFPVVFRGFKINWYGKSNIFACMQSYICSQKLTQRPHIDT